MLRPLSLRGPSESRLQTRNGTAAAMHSLYHFKPRVLTPPRHGVAGVASRRAGSSVAERAAEDGKVRARTRSGAAAPCFPTLGLAQVSLPARPRSRSVLLCVLAPCLSSVGQPDLRLHSVGGRRLPDAALEPTFDGCPAAARGSSMAARRSSRRRPWCHRGVPRCPEEAALEVRTAVERRACCLPLASRSTRTHYRAEGPLEPL